MMYGKMQMMMTDSSLIVDILLTTMVQWLTITMSAEGNCEKGFP